MNKTNIIVHNPCNERTRRYRNYNLFWDELTIYLKKYFNVEENRYFEFADSKMYLVKLKKGISDEFYLKECEYVIENLDNGEFHIISVSDELAHAALNERANPLCKTILISQFEPTSIEHHAKEYFYKYKPWVYFQSTFADLDELYLKRQLIASKEKNLFFRGTSLADRSFLDHLDKNYITGFNPCDSVTYFNELITHKLAISIDGRGEFCYRDIECFGCGVPVIRFEFKSIFNDPLIPNYHYISIPRPNDMVLYRQGTKEHADVFMEKYFEVIENVTLLEQISNNARNYYLKNLTYDNMLKNTFDLLELKNWLI